jgi:hypothetical protein
MYQLTDQNSFVSLHRLKAPIIYRKEKIKISKEFDLDTNSDRGVNLEI